jgi:HAD superfamily hydrolase (TIGR01509 family)
MLLIFDCDGVLVDSEQLANSTLAELMTSLGHPMTAEQAIRTFTGRSLADVVALAESLLGRRIPGDVGERFGERLLARFRSELAPVAGVRAAIAALPYRKCVASSSTCERLALSLELTGLAPLFGQHVYSATQVARGKPAPDLFLFASQSMDETPSDCIVIEDSVLGIEAARAAGMTAIGFVGASHANDDLARCLAAAGASIVIHSMAELPAAVERLATAGGIPT